MNSNSGTRSRLVVALAGDAKNAAQSGGQKTRPAGRPGVPSAANARVARVARAAKGAPARAPAQATRLASPPAGARQSAWLPTGLTMLIDGARRKLWRSAKDASAVAVKRFVKGADGARKARFTRVKARKTVGGTDANFEECGQADIDKCNPYANNPEFEKYKAVMKRGCFTADGVPHCECSTAFMIPPSIHNSADGSKGSTDSQAEELCKHKSSSANNGMHK